MGVQFKPETKVKYGWSKYRKPTPDLMRKLGDGILASSTLISTYAVAEEWKVVALCSILLGAVGKFMTNFFTKE